MNQLFFVILICALLISIIIGELWIHQKALFLFPRYFRLILSAMARDEEYTFTHNEKMVLTKFGRRLVMMSLYIIWCCLFIITLTGNITLNYGLIGLISIFFILFYQYHASFKD